LPALKLGSEVACPHAYEADAATAAAAMNDRLLLLRLESDSLDSDPETQSRPRRAFLRHTMSFPRRNVSSRYKAG